MGFVQRLADAPTETVTILSTFSKTERDVY